jgi:hypothetical protein
VLNIESLGLLTLAIVVISNQGLSVPAQGFTRTTHGKCIIGHSIFFNALIRSLFIR